MTVTGPSSPLMSGEQSSEYPREQPSEQPSEGSPVFRAIMGVAGHPFNALVLRFAGSRYLRLYGVVHHRGRRSGRTYTTPVVVRPTADGFVIPLAFGERADWFRNVRAAGGCEIRWNGTTYWWLIRWPSTGRPHGRHSALWSGSWRHWSASSTTCACVARTRTRAILAMTSASAPKRPLARIKPRLPAVIHRRSALGR